MSPNKTILKTGARIIHRKGFYLGGDFPRQGGIFDRHKVFKMLLSKGKITQDLVNMLMSWRHSGFNVFCGPRIQPGKEEAMASGS